MILIEIKPTFFISESEFIGDLDVLTDTTGDPIVDTIGDTIKVL